jgi:hypothetical protein
MAAMAAVGSGLSDVPNPEQLAVWVYSDAVPKGQLTQEQAGSLIRAHSLSQSSPVPAALLNDVLADARQFVRQLSMG